MLHRLPFVILTIALGIAPALSPAQDKAQPAPKDLDQFQGTWVFASIEADGNPAPDHKRGDPIRTITFEGDNFQVKLGDQVVQAGTQKLDPTKNPKTIDATVTEGDGKGTTQLGIYDIKGDILKACFDPQGKKRPGEFKSTPGSGLFLAVVLRDVKDGVSRNDPSIVYDRVYLMNTGFKAYNGNTYDKATLSVDSKQKLVLPNEKTEVKRHDKDEVIVFMEKRVFMAFHIDRPVSVGSYRSGVGCAVKLEKGELLIGTFGEFGFLEGGVSLQLLVFAPQKMQVEQRVGLIGGYGGRAGSERAKDAINPTKDDPIPPLTKTKAGSPDCWLPPTAEDGWHEIPAVADAQRLAGGKKN